MTPQTAAKQLSQLLKDNGLSLAQGGESLVADAEAYAAASLERLAMGANEPGYQGQLLAERDAVALKYAACSVDAADAIDHTAIGIITGAMHIAVVALAGA